MSRFPSPDHCSVRPGVRRKINDVNIKGWRNALGNRPDSGNGQRMSKTSAFFLGPGNIKCLPQGDISRVAVHNWLLENLEDADFEWASHALGLSIVYRPQAQAPSSRRSVLSTVSSGSNRVS